MDQRLQQLSSSVTNTGSVIDWPLPSLLLACLPPELLKLTVSSYAALAARLQACRSYASCHRLSASLMLAVSWLGRRSLAAQPECCTLLAELLEGALGRERAAVQELQGQGKVGSLLRLWGWAGQVHLPAAATTCRLC